MARGARARGKRIAFGDGKSIIWDHHSEQIFCGNPNIAPPGSEPYRDIEWIPFYRGNRIYNQNTGSRWVWNMDFRPTPGEVFFNNQELVFARHYSKEPFIVIEPNVLSWKPSSRNKQWPPERYREVADRLMADGHRIVQFDHGEAVKIAGARMIKAPDFRHAMAVLKNAALYIGPEGGLHHAAAATGTPGVVLFGGFIPPAVTGYAIHANLTGNAQPCGSHRPCEHCKSAMDAITVAEVLDAAQIHLKVAA